MTTDLEWFDRLHPDEKISLLRDPCQKLAGNLAKRLFIAKELVGSEWLSNDGGTQWSLSPKAASHLSAIKAQLDHWWSDTLKPTERAYIMDNRNGELDHEYAELVQRASIDPVSHGPNAYLVVLVADNKTGRFRLPKMIRAYVEMKAREG